MLVTLVCLKALTKKFAGEQTPRVLSQGGFPAGTVRFGATPPYPRLLSLAGFPVLHDVRGGSNPRLRHRRNRLARENQARRVGDSNPAPRACARGVFAREVSVSCATGRLTLGERACAVRFRFTVDVTAHCATRRLHRKSAKSCCERNYRSAGLGHAGPQFRRKNPAVNAESELCLSSRMKKCRSSAVHPTGILDLAQ